MHGIIILFHLQSRMKGAVETVLSSNALLTFCLCSCNSSVTRCSSKPCLLSPSLVCSLSLLLNKYLLSSLTASPHLYPSLINLARFESYEEVHKIFQKFPFFHNNLDELLILNNNSFLISQRRKYKCRRRKKSKELLE